MNSDITEKRFYKHAPLASVHLKVYLAIILGQLTSGYAIQISGSAIAAAQKQMAVSSVWLGLIGAGTLIGLAGSLLVGKLSDHVGRRRLLLVNMYGLALVSLGQLLTTNLAITFILRVLVGLMIAVDYTAGNTLLIEWLPFKQAGKLQSHLILYWTLGFIGAYPIGAWIANLGPDAWRWMMVSPLVPALITAIFRSVVHLPTSPSWLVNQGKPKAAQRVIRRHLGHGWGLSKRQQQTAQAEPAKLSWTVLFSKKYLRQTAVGGVFYASQAFSFFGISIFLPILVKEMHIGTTAMVSSLYNGCMMLGVIIGMIIFNRMSRRHFLVWDFVFAALCLLALALWRPLPSALALGLFALFATVLSAGLVIDYPYTSELFDSRVRGTGVGLVVTISRFGAAAGTFLLPIIVTNWGIHVTMLVCGLFLLFAGVFCLWFAPETARAAQRKASAQPHAN